MTDNITLTGVVATPPTARGNASGLPITGFRLASTQRKYDRAQNSWSDGETNWYSVSTYRQLATNTLASLKVGERVILTGRLRVRQWAAGDKSGTAVEIDVDSLGHDLMWGTTQWSRAVSGSGGASATTAPTEPADPSETFPSDSDAAAVVADWAVSVAPIDRSPEEVGDPLADVDRPF